VKGERASCIRVSPVFLYDLLYHLFTIYCRIITGRLTMQTSLGLPENPII